MAHVVPVVAYVELLVVKMELVSVMIVTKIRAMELDLTACCNIREEPLPKRGATTSLLPSHHRGNGTPVN